MNFSMDGFRRNLSHDVETLRDIVAEVINGDFYYEEDLVEAVNEVITHSNVINCVYDDENPDFNNMSDIELALLEHQGA